MAQTTLTVNAPTTIPLPKGTRSGGVVRMVDPYILASVVALLALGTVMIYSATAVRSYARDQSSTAFLLQHLVSLSVGLIALAVTLRIPIERWSRHAYLLLALTLTLLTLVYVPGVGRRVNGALRWISIGPAAFQPGELAKLAVVVYLAHSLAKKRDKVRTFSIGFLPHAAVTGLVVLLVLLQPDFGTSAIICGILGLMMFVAGTRIGYLVVGVVLALPVAAHYIASRPHAWARLSVFLDPEAHRTSVGYQIWESLVSFGSGGTLGAGLGQGRQKLFFLPEAHTDFVFAVVGEELGFVGVTLVVTLFAVLIGRGIRAAFRSKVRFSMFLAVGISGWLGAQALMNMAVVTALVPTKGLTLPFVSYGGSSTIAALIAVGILLRITAEQRAIAAEGEA